MNGVFHVVGGYKEHYTQFSNILAWDAVGETFYFSTPVFFLLFHPIFTRFVYPFPPLGETWVVAGHLANARSNQAVMEVTLDLFDFCVHTTATFDYSKLIVTLNHDDQELVDHPI